jgi:hypothetical protein
MSIQRVTVEDTVKEWIENPEKLLAFIQHLLWKARINPDDSLIWRTSKGKIELFDGETWRMESEKNEPLLSHIKEVENRVNEK